ncbi:MAG: T9SS type A sorting domain-containing protein [Cyclobacteriaceae bacterium]
MKKRTTLLFFTCLFVRTIFAQIGNEEISQDSTDAPYGYIEYLPEGYSDGDELFPLLIYLHGLGETGNGTSDLYKLRINGPHKRIDQGASFDAIVTSPQSATWWDTRLVDQFVEWLLVHYRIDTSRIYMTGLSMGGGGTWLYAKDYHEKLAAIIPICGAAGATGTANLVNTPVWAFHNDGDPTVNVQLTYNWINGIRHAGGSPNLTIYEKNVHDAWTETYENPDVWDWLFAQKLGTYTPTPLSTQEIRKATTYPNPFTHEVHVRLSKNEYDALTEIILIDSQGKMCQKWNSPEWHEGYLTLPMNHNSFAPGIYFLRLTTQGHNYEFNIIKE